MNVDASGAETEQFQGSRIGAPAHYDRQISVFERILFGDGRRWVCEQTGERVIGSLICRSGHALTTARTPGWRSGCSPARGTSWLDVALIAVSGLAVMLLVQSRVTAGTWLAGALLLGSAVANVLDRADDGSVTDPIDVGAWPTFNLADVAITLGVTVFALRLARGPRSSDERPAPRPRQSAAADQAASERLAGGGG